MMRIKILLIPLLLLTALFSCKKDDVLKSLEYPSIYYRTGVTASGDFMVFSQNGKITDPAIINRFLATDSSFYSYTINEINTYQGYTIDTVQFSDMQHAIVNARYYSLNCSIDHQKNEIVLTRVDTSTGYSGGDQFTASPMYYLGQVKPEVYSEYLISSTRGNYYFGYTTREKFIVEESKGHLIAPLILFKEHTPQNYYDDYLNNALEKNFYKDIAPGDTVTIRQYSLSFEKK